MAHQLAVVTANQGVIAIGDHGALTLRPESGQVFVEIVDGGEFIVGGRRLGLVDATQAVIDYIAVLTRTGVQEKNITVVGLFDDPVKQGSVFLLRFRAVENFDTDIKVVTRLKTEPRDAPEPSTRF